jgi:hypothetical protein
MACVCPNTNNNRQSSNTNVSNTNAPNTNASSNSTSNTKAKGTNANQAPPIDPEKEGLRLVSSKWQKGGFGTVAVWRVTIENISDKPLGDIKFRTAYYSETKNKVGQGGVDGLIGKDTIEKIVPPKSKRTFEVNDGFVSDEANTGSFELVSWRVIQ